MPPTRGVRTRPPLCHGYAAVALLTLSIACSAAPAERAEALTTPPGSALRAPHEKTALDRYVAAPDSHFSWKAVRTTAAEGVTATLIELTSQRWLTTTREVQDPDLDILADRDAAGARHERHRAALLHSSFSLCIAHCPEVIP